MIRRTGLPVQRRPARLAECHRPGSPGTRRGELYRVRRPGADPKRSHVFVIVSRQVLLDSNFSTVVCAPVYSQAQGLTRQVSVGLNEGLKHESCSR